MDLFKESLDSPRPIENGMVVERILLVFRHTESCLETKALSSEEKNTRSVSAVMNINPCFSCRRFIPNEYSMHHFALLLFIFSQSAMC
jgi:hypothetical protein